MDAEEAYTIDSDAAWERFKSTSVFKSSSSDKLDTMNAMLNDMKVTMDRMASTIPGAQADAAAIDAANASAQPPMGMDMGMGGPGAIPDVSQMSGEDDFESEDADMADEYDDSNIPMKDEETSSESISPAEGAPAEEPSPEDVPAKEPSEEATEEEAAAEMPEEMPEAPIEDVGLGESTDIGTATTNLMNALDQQIMSAVQSGDKESVMKLMDQKDQISAILSAPAAPAAPTEGAVPGAEDMGAPAAPAEGADESNGEMSDDELSALIDDILANKDTEAVKASDSMEVPEVSDAGATTAGGMGEAGTTPNEPTTSPVEASCSSDDTNPAVKSETEHPATSSTNADGQTLASMEDMIAERMTGKPVEKSCSEKVNMAAGEKTTPVEASDAVAEAEKPTDIGSGDATETEDDMSSKPVEAINNGESKEKDDMTTISTSDNPPKTENSSEGTQSAKTIKSYLEMVEEWNAVKKGDAVSEATGIECASSKEVFDTDESKDPDEISTAEDPHEVIGKNVSEEKDDEATIESSEPAEGQKSGDQGTQSTVKSETSEEPAPTGRVMKSFIENLRELNMDSNSFRIPAGCTPEGDLVDSFKVRKSGFSRDLPSFNEMLKEARSQ